MNSLSDRTNFLFRNCVFSFPFFHSIPSKKPAQINHFKTFCSGFIYFLYRQLTENNKPVLLALWFAGKCVLDRLKKRWMFVLPVVYGRGGYLVSPVNSPLSYLARIHCSTKTLQTFTFDKKHFFYTKWAQTVVPWGCDSEDFRPPADDLPYFTSTVCSCTSHSLQCSVSRMSVTVCVRAKYNKRF